ncbi:MAG: Vesicle-fusing ATPase [Caldanaerobacter subterraneus]|jgi:ATP-dependent metalloprotease FtsH|uniref:Microtubule-severing ATPase n=2 Tax=Thermoanaerobacter TaxID=1754 RepID=B0K7I2_THEP3|nr:MULTISPECIES: AAA family ATPase [Thermoanaerobacter]KUJ91369.1 MAG: microtubule-severing ATPase [Thermoanaerobacter thermocopriae]KUK35507.1 MAG: Vesicle-fusing ATPase [Caldanaerobacter subterraneus]ABY91400.1 Microtubule-severing ATPase [Thermoanaerobacter sp. X514]ABY95748.1 Microtubule-severing ATPase [Thermoanaerobacter pseudethanolicus ATCC 33223]ADV80678.1 Vesicle-fusing ATPase [Thermoanaerobacter brockii subsp. finnii Ako-1]
MVKEILLGVVIAFAIFAALLGINVTPLLFLAGVFLLLNYIIENKGLIPGSKNIIKPESEISFEDIGGQKTAISELKEALDFVINKEKLSKMGIRPIKGILLTGPPGTGKTLLAKAAAKYTNSSFIATSGSEFIEMYAGVGAQRVRNLFETARNLARKENKNSAIIFIDEIDILGAKRGTNESHHEYDQTLNQLLVEMDGIKSDGEINILVIAATNRPDLLDPALLRPGRFDRQVVVDLPDKSGRLQILKIHTKNKPLGEDVNLEAIAENTFGFSGAHLESLCNEAAILAMRDNSDVILQKHFVEAVDKVILGEKSDKKPAEEEIFRVSVHEAGHAIISEIVNPGSVATVTIVPRGKALGFVRQFDKEDTLIYTKEQLEKDIMVALGGTVAELLVLGNRSTGSVNDFEQAVHIAKKMVYTGLSGLGIVSREDVPKEKVNEEVNKIIKEEEEKVQKMLEEKLEHLEEIANILRKEETISGEKLRELISAVKL